MDALSRSPLLTFSAHMDAHLPLSGTILRRVKTQTRHVDRLQKIITYRTSCCVLPNPIRSPHDHPCQHDRTQQQDHPQQLSGPKLFCGYMYALSAWQRDEMRNSHFPQNLWVAQEQRPNFQEPVDGIDGAQQGNHR